MRAQSGWSNYIIGQTSAPIGSAKQYMSAFKMELTVALAELLLGEFFISFVEWSCVDLMLSSCPNPSSVAYE